MLLNLLLYVHILSAMVMVGISLANGAGKILSDRTGNVHRIVSMMSITVVFNKVLVLPSLIVLALSGIGMALSFHFPLLNGWVFQAIILFVIIFSAYFVGNYYENRLHRIAKESERNKQQEISPNYWKVTRTYVLTGFPVLIAIFLILYLMIFQKSL